jgi:hypothetical protein
MSSRRAVLTRPTVTSALVPANIGKNFFASPTSSSEMTPSLEGIRAHLNKIKMSFMVLFDTQINETSRLAQNTLAPIAYKHKNTLRIHKGFTERTVANLFKNLQKANMCSLDDLSPYFDMSCRHISRSFRVGCSHAV